MSATDHTTATKGVTEPGSARVGPVRIEVLEGGVVRHFVELASGTLIVGSHSSCELVIADPTVSRRHVALELLPGVVRARDLASRNGTLYLGARVPEVLVPIGGSLQIGKTVLRFAPVDDGPALSEREELCGLVGGSVVMRRVFAVMERVGPLDVTVLVQGETGVGKDSVARALHALSPRAQEPFVVFDCAGVSRTLFESELFGHVQGAFTGAERDRLGAVAAANGGTLYLDAVDELPLELQPKLLRLLEAREYRPVGALTPETASVRIVAATRRELRAEAEEGRFRSDLYHRLAVVELQLPPLRERREDILPLATRFARKARGVDLQLGPATLSALQCEDWPGNVRELRNAVERALALGETAHITGRQPLQKRASYHEARAHLLERFEHDYLGLLMELHQGNLSGAAREAGISRMTLYRLLEKHGIRVR